MILPDADATELAARLRAGDVSSEELVASRLAVLDGLSHLGAVAWRDDERVRGDAREADRRRANGDQLGVLHGVPVTVKDWLDVVGFPCAAGEPSRADRRPTADATVVARMRTAGAVVLAKTCVGEVGYHGPVRNPWDPTRTAGPSSSGEAVTVSTGASALGLGSDSGGSLRFPAHCSGLAALRPTYARVPVTGHVPRVGLLVDGRTAIGPLARSVRDLRLGLDVIGGPDGLDPTTPPVAPVGHVDVEGLRVAVHRDGGDASCDPAILAALDDVAAALARAGAVTDDRDVLDVRRSTDVTLRYWGRAQLERGEVEALLRDWDRSRRDAMVLLGEVDAVVSPAAPHVAPVLGELGIADWTYLLGPSLWGWPALALRVGEVGGLPIAVQIVAGPWREEVALALAEVVEAHVGTVPLAPAAPLAG